MYLQQVTGINFETEGTLLHRRSIFVWVIRNISFESLLYALKYSDCTVISFNDIFQKLFLPLSEAGDVSEADIS